MKIILIFLLLCGSAQAGIIESMQSVVMLHDHGTGVVYKEDKDNFYILTAGHCVQDSKGNLHKIWVYFYPDGRPTGPYETELVEIDYNGAFDLTEQRVIRDLAVLKVSKQQVELKDYPKITPIADVSYLEIGDKILSIGCPGPKVPLGHPTMFLGNVNKILNEAFYFKPTVLQGRSGSPVFDENGESIIGIVIWTTNDGGRAISLNGILSHF